jgi:hypothetical protein
MTFQQFQLMADRGRSDAQLGSGQPETEMASGCLKRTQFGERRQFAHVGILDELISSAPEFFEFAAPNSAL